MEFYYIVDNVGSSSNDLPSGQRIFKISYGDSSMIIQFKNGDGPYRTIKELRKSSKRFKNLLTDDPQRAQKIYNKRFLISVADKILFPRPIDQQLKGKLFQMLDHAVSGKIKKNNVSGIHFFESNFHRIIEITKEKNEKGIWEARIEAIRQGKNDWIKKGKPSTFFPTDWTKDLLVIKLHEAFRRKKKLTDKKFIGKTECGINVVFIIEDKEIVSVYPKYD